MCKLTNTLIVPSFERIYLLPKFMRLLVFSCIFFLTLRKKGKSNWKNKPWFNSRFASVIYMLKKKKCCIHLIKMSKVSGACYTKKYGITITEVFFLFRFVFFFSPSVVHFLQLIWMQSSRFVIFLIIYTFVKIKD